MSARFGQNLRAVRDRAGLTQRGLAKRLGFAGPSTISHWESGAALPAPETISTLAAALRCSSAELLAGVVTPYDRLRGQQEQPGPPLLLSDEETALIATYRGLGPDWRRTLRDSVLPAFAAATAHARRRRGGAR